MKECIESVDVWIDIPFKEYNDYLLLEVLCNRTYIVLSDEVKSIIYRDGYFEVGGNFVVYRYYKGMWYLEEEGFGSPTYEAIFVEDLGNIVRVSSKYNIVDIRSGNIVVCKTK